MRLDKFLKDSRIIKRRTVASEACDNGRVVVNEKPAKAGYQVSIGDIIEIKFGQQTTCVKVLKLIENPKKDQGVLMYESYENDH